MKTFATLTAAAALALAGAAAVAQTTPPAAPPAQGAAPATPTPQATPAPQGERRGGFSAADRQALVDARLAGVPVGLKLTAEQQGLWRPVEQALRANAQERISRMEERRNLDRAGQQQDLDIMQRLDERSQRVTEAAQRLQSLAAAMKPFWTSLSADQKRLLPVLIQPHHGDGRWRGGRDRDHDRGERMGRGERHGMMGRPGMMDYPRMVERHHGGDRDGRGMPHWR